MTENVRAALVLVARGEAALGIVYETDAAVEPGVKVVGRFPANSHPPITYPVALTATAKPEAVRISSCCARRRLRLCWRSTGSRICEGGTVRFFRSFLTLGCRPRESGDPVNASLSRDPGYWIPAFAGMTPTMWRGPRPTPHV